MIAVSKLINQAVGDALSGLLLVEAILRYMRWSIHRWNELYQDLPSRQLKVSLSAFIFKDEKAFLLLDRFLKCQFKLS